MRAAGNHQIALGKNPERSREHNRRVVLDVVRRNGALGRMEMARLTQLTAQAIANIVDDLVSENLLMKTGRLRSGRGQPPIQYAVNPRGAATLGVEVAADHVAFTLLDLAGHPLERRTEAAVSTTPDSVAGLLRSALAQVRANTSTPLLGVGVVMPGPFLIEGMTSVGPTTLPGWDRVEPAKFLSEACGEPVMVENDATAAAVGERLFGVGQNISNFCMVYFGAGVGLGMIQEGAPYRGAFGNAGEIGHVVVTPQGKACPCGQSGCLERYASLHALREALAASGRSDLSLGVIARLHAERDPVITAWIGEAARLFGPLLAMLENVLDPETIVLGGALPETIMGELIERVGPLPVSVANRGARALPRIMLGNTGHYTAALGAAALPMFEAVTPKLETHRAAPRITEPVSP